MKNGISLILITFFLMSCGGDSNNGSPLEGAWRSNCHEVIDSDDSSLLGYSISEMIFDNGTVDQSSTYFDDATCSNQDGDIEDEVFTYSIGGLVETSGGKSANRITFIINSIGGEVLYEFVYLIEGKNLNFGEYEAGEAVEIDYALTYTRID